MFVAEAAILRCRMGTRFGRPVLPLVCSTRAISSGRRPRAVARRSGASAMRTNPVASISSEYTGILPSAALRASGAPSGGQSRIRAGVFQIKAEFILAVAGIERRGRARDRSGQETHDRRAVRWAAPWPRGRRARCPSDASASAMVITCSRSEP